MLCLGGRDSTGSGGDESSVRTEPERRVSLVQSICLYLCSLGSLYLC